MFTGFVRYKVPIGAVDTHRPKPKSTVDTAADTPLNTTARQYLTPDNPVQVDTTTVPL